MSREIKFRAWSEYSNKMVDWESMINEESSMSVLNGDDEKIHVMQFTGLKDKKGRDIYEGDIYTYEIYKVFISGGNVEDSTSEGFDIIEFKDGAFYLGDELLYDVLEDDDSLSYAGNIYENPELINE